MATADKNVIYMHALPADRNNEVEDSVLDGPHSVVYDEAENVIGFGKLTRDLTERKRTEYVNTLEIKNKELEQFNYIASHDLQEPLRTVSNYIQVLEEDFSDQLNDEAKNHLKVIERATTRMSILVRSLLDYSRLGKNKQLVFTDCRLIVDHVIADLNNLIKTTGATILAEDLPVIQSYETELRQLFQNLIHNAIKFSKKDIKPVVKIGFKKGIDSTEFYVSDNGIGIDTKHFDRIFNIFQRLNKEQKFEGYGIGLANCKKIVELHGGRIWVESNLGEGSTFKFTLANF